MANIKYDAARASGRAQTGDGSLAFISGGLCNVKSKKNIQREE